MIGRYSIVITGPIGAGKTTIARAVSNQYGFQFVPEYIDGHPQGQRALESWRSGEITLDEFQEFIIRAQEMINERVESCQARVFERSPVENALIFSVGSSCYEKTLHDSERIHEMFGIPDPRDTESVCVVDASRPIEVVMLDVFSIICGDIYGTDRTQSRVIYLRLPPDECERRIRQRGRPSEESYTGSYLKMVCDRYDKLFCVDRE